MKPLFSLLLITLSAFSTIGCTISSTACIMSARDAVPAYRLPALFRTCERNRLAPIDLNLLGQKQPADGHRIDDGDLLGVYVAGVMPPKVDDSIIVNPPTAIAGTVYYPAYGRLNTPAAGIPVDVRSKGIIRLPLIGSINLAGKTLNEATDIVRVAYEKAGHIQQDRERVALSLIRPRVQRVVVLREDSQATSPQFINKVAVPYTKLGHGEVIDLPVYENDVLHALAATGGLPGIDVYSEVWIFRNRDSAKIDSEVLRQQIQAADSHEQFAEKWSQKENQLVRIPLRLPHGESIPFDESDVILQDGDIIYLPPRELDVFYSGGVLPGGKVPMPRDQDIDILEAIALVNGATGGPSGAGIFRTGPGNVYPPTQCLVVRKLPNGQQIRIRVDLNRALHDPNERLLIQPEDQVLLFFTTAELYSNLMLNFIGFGVNLVPSVN